MILKCLKCCYQWTPRKKDRPKECPNCKTRDWDGRNVKERVRRVAGRHSHK
jgi:hypothetical protein